MRSDDKALPTEGDMSLMDHLRELRRRLIFILAFVAGGALLCYFIAPFLFEILCIPYYKAFPSNSLIGTGPAEAIMLRINVSVFAGAVLVSPAIFYQVWLFISPGLAAEEKRFFLPFVLTTSALFLVGMIFCYFIMLPLSMDFFEGQYEELGLHPQVKMSEHLSLMIHLLIGFGVIFELPILSYFLARMGIIDHKMMVSWGRHAIVGIFIIAAVLTPPDVVSQMAMAVPLLALYGLSILIVRGVNRRDHNENVSVPADAAGNSRA